MYEYKTRVINIRIKGYTVKLSLNKTIFHRKSLVNDVFLPAAAENTAHYDRK